MDLVERAIESGMPLKAGRLHGGGKTSSYESRFWKNVLVRSKFTFSKLFAR